MIAARERRERLIARFGESQIKDAIFSAIGFKAADLLAVLSDDVVEAVAISVAADHISAKRRNASNRAIVAARQ